MNQESSVVMITYNGERFLDRQLESLASQNRLPNELIVCDDGSTDGTLSILERFSREAPFPVSIERNEFNLGPGLNFRKAFFLATKEVSFFCDQDDVWLPHKIESAMSLFESCSDVGMVLMNDVLVDSHQKPLFMGNRKKYLERPIRRDNSFHTLLKCRRFGWAAHNMACRTSFRERVFGNNLPPYAQWFDQWLFRCLGALTEVRTIVEPTALFRRHGGNVTTHSKHKRSLSGKLLHSYKRHVDIERVFEQYQTYRQVCEYLLSHETEADRTVTDFYTRCQNHHEKRLDAISSLIKRPGIIIRQMLSGDYSSCARGSVDAFLDLIAMRQTIDRQQAEKEVRK